MDKCSKHDEVMGRTFDEINEIKLKVEKIDTKMDGVIDFKNMVHDIIFGTSENCGLKAKVETIGTQLSKQWALLIIIITAVITAVAVQIWKG